MNVSFPARVAILLAASVLSSGCLVTQGTYEAEVARSRALEHEMSELSKRITVLERRNRDLLKTGAKLELERSSLMEERVALLDSLEDLRQGNEQIVTQLERERRVREQREAELAEVSTTYQDLVEGLEKELEAGELEIRSLREGIQVRASDEILFSSGSANVKASGKRVLAKVAEQIRNVQGYTVRVGGHTDNVPISTPRFPSNWELSADRAAGVVRYLVEQGVDPSRITAVAYAEYRPSESNETAAGRARNRRIEIVLVPDPK